MDYSLPGSSVQGIFQARILQWVAMPLPGDLPNPGIEPSFPALAGRFFFTTEPPGLHQWARNCGKCKLREFSGGPMLKTPSFSLLRSQVQPLVRELKSHKPSGMTEMKK